ncbi:GNAT family N-acetyltransferase [Olivibacter sp. SDN3]|uniref:GNAT family N-acetyltransferase n=1 Tax=Olivibacter sp. SDN3 TaxID=2764720 RepID=UPI00165159D8|nr:GNAT family N-acetyltransferase [Olivibacter sp. SDN3]QNL48760.1 GNAT family N-acetyltransferase [Olivibacter sp. SDN3]
MINIRKADIDDVITISKLGRITFSDTFESFFNDKNDLLDYLEDIFSEKRIHDSILKAKSIYWIAFYDSIPVGYAKVKLDFTSQLIIPPNTCYLDKIYVVKKFISKEIGKELHKILMQEIIALKYQRIWLSVLKENQKAINFYHKKGYQIISQYSQNIGSQKFDFFVMALNLDEKAT